MAAGMGAVPVPELTLVRSSSAAGHETFVVQDLSPLLEALVRGDGWMRSRRAMLGRRLIELLEEQDGRDDARVCGSRLTSWKNRMAPLRVTGR